MISILRHVRLGDFTLHSGDRSEVLFDVLSMLGDRHVRGDILRELEAECRNIPYEAHHDRAVAGKFRLVGIELGGAILAALLAEKMELPFAIYRWSKAEIVGDLNANDAVILIDDVVTTNTSMFAAREAITKRGAKVLKEVCAVDRRELAV